MLYCLELRDLLVGQLAIPYFLYLTYGHTSLSLLLPLPTQSSLRMFAAGRVSNQLLVSHERSGRAKCILSGHS